MSCNIDSRCREDFSWSADMIIDAFGNSEGVANFAAEHKANIEKIRLLTAKMTDVKTEIRLLPPDWSYGYIAKKREIIRLEGVLPRGSLAGFEKRYEKLTKQINIAMVKVVTNEERRCEPEKIGYLRTAVRAIIRLSGCD